MWFSAKDVTLKVYKPNKKLHIERGIWYQRQQVAGSISLKSPNSNRGHDSRFLWRLL